MPCPACGSTVGSYNNCLCSRCENDRRLMRNELQARQQARSAAREAVEDAKERRFHPVFFLFIGWLLGGGYLCITAAMRGIPLILLLTRSGRRFVGSLFGYY